MNNTKEAHVAAVQGRMEEYMTLIRVYYQAVIVVNLGITNIQAVPDMAMFKRSLKIPTTNGRLGVAEKARARKMLMDIYGLSASFFDEVDASLKRGCKKPADIQTYLHAFQGFSNNLVTLLGSVMQWQLRIPALFRKTLFSATQKAMREVADPNKFWKKEDVRPLVKETQKLKERLRYSEQWMAEFVFPVILIAKNSKRPRL